MATSRLFLFLLISSIIPFSALADVWWSIDCGMSGTYEDNDNIQWQGDENLITTGQSRTVKTTGKSFHNSSGTLRVFDDSEEKNCYALKGEQGAKLLVRASFFYGNYDGNSFPPSFDLEIDGNNWDTVETDMEDFTFKEVTYVSMGDLVSVCLVQTDPDQYPFISALEVRTLGSVMYNYYFKDGTALNLYERSSYGSGNVVRYPKDSYDRIWMPYTLTDLSMELVTGDASSIDTTTVLENPPKDAIVNGITIQGTLTELVYSTDSQFHIILYFTEVRHDIDPAREKRRFNVYLYWGPMIQSYTGIPPYGTVTEATFETTFAVNNMSIRLEATPDSTLPPIINAIEVFKLINYSVYEPATATSAGLSGGAMPPPSSHDKPVSSNQTNQSISFHTPAPSSGKKKSSPRAIFSAGIPGFLLLAAFAYVGI